MVSGLGNGPASGAVGAKSYIPQLWLATNHGNNHWAIQNAKRVSIILSYREEGMLARLWANHEKHSGNGRSQNADTHWSYDSKLIWVGFFRSNGMEDTTHCCVGLIFFPNFMKWPCSLGIVLSWGRHISSHWSSFQKLECAAVFRMVCWCICRAQGSTPP